LYELLKDAAVLALVIASLSVALSTYARHERGAWSRALLSRRLLLLCLLALALTAMKVSEDVIGNESGLFDRTILIFVHAHLGSASIPFFQAVTRTGSFLVVFCFAAAASVGLLLAGHRLEAGLIGISTTVAALCVWALKALVGRARPALWETQWYWGSSFPSGHTLVTAALGIALALAVHRLWPAWQWLALAVAVSWIALVALSRLALGVHWPTDVIAAACIGALLPLSLGLGWELLPLRRNSSPRE
jgi:undecaprenyl-diphosphatase